MRKRPERPIDSSIFQTAYEFDLNPTALDTPERMLEYCREKKFFNNSATNIKALIEDNPELTLEFDDIGEFDGFIEKIGPKAYRIVVNSKHPPNRQRFTMAHEYIHYQIHRDEIEKMPKGEKILHRSEEKNRIEYQANQYAGELLMPEIPFKQIAHIQAGDIPKIAKQFEVSQLAVRFRAKLLGIDGHGL